MTEKKTNITRIATPIMSPRTELWPDTCDVVMKNLRVRIGATSYARGYMEIIIDNVWGNAAQENVQLRLRVYRTEKKKYIVQLKRMYPTWGVEYYGEINARLSAALQAILPHAEPFQTEIEKWMKDNKVADYSIICV